MGLLVVGSVAYDSIETPTEKVEDSLGGAATYISLAASYFTKPVHMIGVVGEDFKDDHYNMLKNHGIDLEGLQIIKGGWHFSFLQTPEDIVKKIKSYSHGEFNTIENTNEEKINKKITENEDIFGRGITLKKIELDTSYPNYILENKEKFSKWII